jgi:kinetochore-associated protein 1
MWTNVEVDLEEKDETVIGDNTSVRVASLALISKEEGSAIEEANSHADLFLSVTASPIGNGLCVLVANQMILFDSNCKQHEATLNLTDWFDCLAWSHNGKFIALGDRSGTLHVFHVSSKELLFSNGIHNQANDQKSSVFANLHFHRCSKTGMSMLVVVTVSGTVYLLCDINLNQLDEAILKSDQNTVLEITKSISTEKLQLQGTEYHSIVVIDKSTGVMLVALDEDSAVSVWSVSQHSGLHLMRRLQKHGSFKLIKCDVTHNCQYLVGLTEENYLVQFDFTTLVLLGVFKEYQVKTFCSLPYGLVSDTSSERKSTLSTVALFTIPESLKPPQLLVCSLPRFNVELTVNVSPIATLPTVSIDEGILYFVECSHYDNANSPIGAKGSQLVVRSVWEESPLNRFLRLLNRHDFEKADQLAQLYGMDRGVIQKHRAMYLLAEISQRDKLDSSMVNSFITSIDQSLSLILDEDFIVSYCLNAAVPSCELMMKLLLIAERRLKEKQISGSQRGSNHELVEKVLSTIQKLTTFHLVTIEFEPSEWQSFRTCCAFNIVIKNIQVGNFDAASVIWRRHEGELMKEITPESIHTLLNSFPTDLHLSSCLSFVDKEMLPLVTTVLPSSKAVLTTWIESVVRNLEVSDKDHWPENGLKLINLFLPYVDIPTRQTWQTVGQFADQIWASSVCCQSAPAFSSVGSLLTLSKHLEELSHLSSKYNMKLTLSEIRKETASSLALQLIDQAVVSGEVVVHLMEDLALSYIAEKKLNRDQTLLNYMKYLYTNQSAVQSNATRMHEQKAVAVLQYLTDAQVYLC